MPPGLVPVVPNDRVDDALGADHPHIGAVREVHGSIRGDGQAFRVGEAGLVGGALVSAMPLVPCKQGGGVCRVQQPTG